MESSKNLRYPIGKFVMPLSPTYDDIGFWAKEIEALPQKLQDLCQDLRDDDLKKQYRTGSWNIRQVLHHLTDSHTHSYIRFKWTLTESSPLIKAYDETKWADLPDILHATTGELLEEINITQRRLSRVIRSLSHADIIRTFTHPETNASVSLGQLAALYAWHGLHHLEHIRIALFRPASEYKPVSCGFYDELVLLSMRRTPLRVDYGDKIVSGVFIEDIRTEEKEEYLILSDGSQVRLDAFTLAEPNNLKVIC